jgi:hypothetical protein
MEVDHWNHDGLDNRRENLRVCTKAQNNHNCRKHRWHNGEYTSSKYKGVCWNKTEKKWMAYIHRKTLGYFRTEEEAALAYNAAATRDFGEFAVLNDIPEQSA